MRPASSSRRSTSRFSPSASTTTGDVGGQHLPQRLDGLRGVAQPGPDHPGLHPAGLGDGVGDDHLGPAPDHLGRGVAGVAHRPDPAEPGRADAQLGRARIGLRARRHPDHAAGVLVVGRARRSAAAGRGGPAGAARGSGSRGPMPRSTSRSRPVCSRPSPTSRPGFSAPMQTVAAARTAGPATAPVSGSTPDGDVDGQHRRRAAQAPAHQRHAAPRAPGRGRRCRAGRPRSGPPGRRRPARPAGRRRPATRPARPGAPGPDRPAPPSTATPRRASSAPAYSASPPLSPGPTSSTTRAP